MNPDRWQTVTALFDKAARLPIAQRDAFLVAACGTDAALLNEVRSLLEVHTDDPEYLEESALSAHGDALEEAIEAQTREDRVGPYKLIRKIGAGGMGSVYLAERDDEEFRKQVAIKFIRGGAMRENAVKRFRRERQILARLEHPGIARLLDGGTTDKGTPYFVMEYVEGKLLLDYCDELGMGVRSRLEIFLKVCEAVEYAHERLIVHRDLKASNILVDGAGNPKLLDFGIAKVLQPDEEGQLTITQTGLRQFTPDYASPEQIRGEQVTTATDVYSLGVLLYEMLTGRRPFRFHGQSAVEILSTLLETDPLKPSAVVGRREEDNGKVIRPELVSWNRRTDQRTLARALSGDLDNIILKALTKKPSERYRTAAALGNDLRAYLDGHVVTARKATLGYRFHKFLARNRWQTGVGLGLALTLVSALGIASWQWREARLERIRAERHSQQSRQMARSLLFELYDALKEVPGATDARKLLLARATRFLDELSDSSGDDGALQYELAEGYRKLAMVQGDLRTENLGDRHAALESYKKALANAESARKHPQYATRALSSMLKLLGDLSVAQQDLGLSAERSASTKQLEVLVGEAEQISSPDGELVLGGALAYRQLGANSVSLGDNATGRRHYERSRELFEALLARQNPPDDALDQYPSTLKRLGALAIAEHRLDEAFTLYTQALKSERTRLAKKSGDWEKRYALTFTLSDLGYIHRQKMQHDQALRHYREALEIREAALAANPRDERARSGVASTLTYLGEIYRNLGWFDQALDAHQRGLTLREELLNHSPHSRSNEFGLAQARMNLAETLLARATKERTTQARTVAQQRCRNLLRQALAVYEERESKGELIGNDVGRPQVLREMIASLDSI
ncbi:MAG: serine/threonine protein kinase [Bryobacterales bacterium]|nr:serine/threonine protein kinase [Bryobacterales bacterium]